MTETRELRGRTLEHSHPAIEHREEEVEEEVEEEESA